jgi:hypothetical protein
MNPEGEKEEKTTKGEAVAANGKCDGTFRHGTVRHMHAAAVAATPDYRALRLRLARVTLGASRQCI